MFRRHGSTAFERARDAACVLDVFDRGSRRDRRNGLQWFGGAGMGLSIPGRQDLKWKKHSELGVLTNYLFSDAIDASVDPMGTFFGGAWLNAFGFEASVSYWRTTVRPKRFANRGPEGGSLELPDVSSLLQQRVSVFANALWRCAMPGDRTLNPDRFFYLGIGGGPVYTKVKRGHTGWALGLQLSAGAVVRISKDTRLRTELRYMVAPDADSPRRAQWRADTSGTRAFPGLAHNDTRFYTLVLAFEHTF